MSWCLGQPLEGIETDRLILRSLKESDVSDEYVAWWNDRELMRGLGRKPRRWDRDRAIDFVGKQNHTTAFHLGLFEKQSGRLIGFFGLSFSLRSRVAETMTVIGDKSFWGTGVAGEARRGMAPFIFETLNARKITGRVYAFNHAMIFNYIGEGFTKEGILRGQSLDPKGGAPVDQIIFGLLKEEWLERR